MEVYKELLSAFRIALQIHINSLIDEQVEQDEIEFSFDKWMGYEVEIYFDRKDVKRSFSISLSGGPTSLGMYEDIKNMCQELTSDYDLLLEEVHQARVKYDDNGNEI